MSVINFFVTASETLIVIVYFVSLKLYFFNILKVNQTYNESFNI